MRTWESEIKTLAAAKAERSGSFHQFMNVARERKRIRESVSFLWWCLLCVVAVLRN